MRFASCGSRIDPGVKEGVIVVLYDEPEASKFIAIVLRLKRRQQRNVRLTRQAIQRLRVNLKRRTK
jgi:hypothetical protein